MRELTVTDVAERSARALKERLGPSSKVRARALDASDPKALEEALEGISVVVQASLPGLNAPIQAACLVAGADYVDLAADSSDPYRTTGEWLRAGRTAILGLGEDPSLSNLMARHLVDGLDRVDAVRVRDGDTASSPDYPFVPLFSPETFLQETLHGSRIWENGRYRDVPPFGDPETYDFPTPVGPQRVYSVDHEEVDSLPRFLGKEVRYVDFKLAMDDRSVGILQMLRDLRLLDPGTLEAPGPLRAVLRALPKPADLAGRIGGNAALVVEATGEKDGVPRSEALYTTMSHSEAFERFGATATAYLTGTPAAVAVVQLLNGTLRQPGMNPPELLETGPFFRMLAERGVVLRDRRSNGLAVAEELPGVLPAGRDPAPA